MNQTTAAPWSEYDQAKYHRKKKRLAAREKLRRKMARQFKKLQPILRAGAVSVHFSDEAPRIGSGQRKVFVDSVGPKWVHIRSIATGKTAKLSRVCWDRLIT